MKKPKEVENYASPAMKARRERILEQTRELISEQGVSGFSLLELCRRADVAKRTLYYAFQSKEGLVAAAIIDFAERYDKLIAIRSPVGTVERFVERLVGVGKRNLKIRNYVGALVATYFSHSQENGIREALTNVSVRAHGGLVEELAKQNQLQPWIDITQLNNDLVSERLCVSHDWVNNRLRDDELIDHMVVRTLTFLLGAVRDKSRRHIEDVLTEVIAIGAEAYAAKIAQDAK